MNQTTKAYLQLHAAVFLFGATAVYGRILSNGGMAGTTVVWWRLIFTLAALMLIAKLFWKLEPLSFPLRKKLWGIGVVVGIHWICFYGSIAVSNASIALSCFASVSFFTALTEPIILKKRIVWSDVLLGLLIMPGILLIANATGIENLPGLVLGILAALFAAIFSTMNKTVVDKVGPQSITISEMTSAFATISLIMPFWFAFSPDPGKFVPDTWDIIHLVFFALVCTVLAYILSLQALKYLTPFTANYAFNLEPIYGAIMAAIILKENETLGTWFYLGMALVMVPVFLYPFITHKRA